MVACVPWTAGRTRFERIQTPAMGYLVFGGLGRARQCAGILHLEEMIHRFGLIPAQLWRYGGLTWISSFFLHGGFWHLISNLYFLLLVGDNVEDYLGRGRFVLLLTLATLGGDALHSMVAVH